MNRNLAIAINVVCFLANIVFFPSPMNVFVAGLNFAAIIFLLFARQNREY